MSKRAINPHYGRGEHKIAGRDLVEPEVIIANLQAKFRSSDYEPPMLPAAAIQVIEMSRDPDVNIEKIRALIETEPLLAARVVRTAQSALYSRRVPVQTLEQAIVQLGLSTLCDIFLQAALSAKVFRAKGYEKPMEALRKHSVVTAHVARVICRESFLSEEYAFLCGLLHDVGTAAGIIAVSDVPRGQAAPDFEIAESAVVAVHEEASGMLARTWRLPADVALVLEHHHHFVIDGRTHPLAAVVCLADDLASQAGAPAGGEGQTTLATQAARELSLTDSAVAGFLEEATLAAENSE